MTLRWPSLEYLIRRDSREAEIRERERMLAHCRKCGCVACMLRLAMMGELGSPVSGDDDVDGEEHEHHLN